MRFLCAALILIAGIGTAAASIRIDQSHYHNGTLTIVGRTDPGQTVTLDGKYKTKSNADGDFTFTEHYKPDTCMSEIHAGGSDYGAVIAGCYDAGVDDDTGEAFGTIDKLPPAHEPPAPLPLKKAAIKPKA